MYTDGVPEADLPTAELGAWDQCDHCQAPLDVRQRYCVVCGARRPHSDDPAARWLADARRARNATGTGAAAAGAGGTGAAGAPDGHPRFSGLALAAAFALLPVAAGIGVFVGRGSGDDSELLVQALKAQKAPVVTVVGGAGGGAAEDASATDDGASSDGDAGSDRAARGEQTSDGNEVLSQSRYGEARRLTGAKITAKTREESKRALDKIVNSKGREYVDSQRGLPDQIVIP
jgi:hypothetical protein